MKKIITGTLVLFVVLASCKKDKKTTCDLTAANMVGSYKTTAATFKATGSTTVIDDFATWDACEKDDITVLNANNTVTYSDAGTRCTPPGDDTGTWALSGNQLTLDGQVITVTSFSCSGATLTATDASGVYTTTVVKQ